LDWPWLIRIILNSFGELDPFQKENILGFKKVDWFPWKVLRRLIIWGYLFLKFFNPLIGGSFWGRKEGFQTRVYQKGIKG